MRFQSTLPLRGATKILKKVLFSEVFQSTLPLRGATRSSRTLYRRIPISIQAPLTGSDQHRQAKRLFFSISSTLPLRGATQWMLWGWDPAVISIHAPLTGSDWLPADTPAVPSISIHAPLRGATAVQAMQRTIDEDFNPRSPYGERPSSRSFTPSKKYFNPRSPYGERLFCHPFSLPLIFHPRSLYGERHLGIGTQGETIAISIHAPLRGATAAFACFRL